jgi:hypothetical protein
MSSFFDSASLVQIPSGYSDGTLYSVKPIDGSGDLTFSRGSDIEATRVASNGYIEKAKVNLISASNDFSNGTYWVSGINFTSGQSGYDGSNDAWKAEAGSLNANIYQVNTTSGVSTFSVYAKAGNIGWVRLRFDNVTSSDINVWFNLSNGSVGSDNSIAAHTENVGGGWWRVVAQLNTTDLNNVRIYPSASDGNNADTGEYIYIQDAQLNYGLVAQEYQETTTTSVVSGITNDMPRLDYSGGASCPSLLLEPSRQNLVTQSEYLDGLAKLSATIASNDITSPEGVDNGSKLKPNSGQTFSIDGGGGYTIGSASYVRSSDLTLTAASYTFSAFVKKGEYDQIQLRSGTNIDTTSGGSGTRVDLNNGTIISSNGTASSIEDYGNGWYRISHTFTATAASWYLNLWFWNTTSVTANGTDGVYAYGFQCEAGSYSTSLIPTYGTSATRTSESCSKTGISSILSASEYTLFWEGTHIPTGEYNSFATFYNNANNNDSARFYRNNTDNQIHAAFFNSATGLALDLASGVTTQTAKCAMRVKAGSYALYVNGALVNSSTSALVPASNLDAVNLQYFSSGQSYDQKTAQVLFFKTALSNADLATLTTL